MNWLNSLNFLSWETAALTAAIAVPALVILYFLKLRRRDLEVSTTLLWRKAIQDLQANAPFQRLRRNILLFLQLLALGAVLAALAQPMIKGQAVVGAKHIILIDRSASMSAVDGDDGSGRPATRLETAKKQAIAFVQSLREGGALFNRSSGDQAMVIAFDAQGEPVQPFTADKLQLKAAIERVHATDKATSIDEAVRVALAHLPRRTLTEDGQSSTVEGLFEGEPVTIHIYSDGRIPDAEKANTGAENTVVFHQVGTAEAGNAAITGLSAERSYEDPGKLTIFTSLENASPEARTVDVEMIVDGSVAGIQTVTLPASGGPQLGAIEAARAAANEAQLAQAAGTQAPTETTLVSVNRPGSGGVVFKLDRTEGMLAQVRLRSPSTGGPLEDALPDDDRAWLVAPPAKRLSVAVVGRGNLFVRAALQGLPLARLDELSVKQFEDAWKQGKASTYDVVVLDGVIPNVGQVTPPAAGAATPPPGAPGAPAAPPATPTALPALTLPPGSYLVLGAIPGGMGLSEIGVSQGASIVDWNREHPATRYLVLDPLAIAAFRQVSLDPASPARSLAMAESGPAIIEVHKGDAHGIVVPFDYMESNWPLDLSFVVFLASSVNYLGEEVGGKLDARALTPGGDLKDRLPLGVTDVRVRKTAGENAGSEETLVTTADGSVVYKLPDRSGVFEVSWKGPTAPGDIKDPDRDRAVRVYASNLLDARESDLGAASSIALAGTNAAAQVARSTRADRRLWPYLLIGALGLVLLEWFVYNRKVHV